jgi:hypothetical protein
MESMKWGTVAASLFAFGWSCIAIYVAKTLHDLGESVKVLNVNVAVVIEKVTNHERRIERLEDK